MNAQIILKRRTVFDDGSLVQMVIWQVPEPVPPSEHHYKYSLVYIVEGNRILGYDNERGKGDHRHSGNSEEGIEFTSLQDLMASFLNEVRALRRGEA